LTVEFSTPTCSSSGHPWAPEKAESLEGYLETDDFTACTGGPEEPCVTGREVDDNVVGYWG
jgi:hypothetical protein